LNRRPTDKTNVRTHRKAAGGFDEPFVLQRRPHDPSEDRRRGAGGPIGVAGVGISARLSADDGLTQTARVCGPVVKASKSVVMTSTDQAVIR